MRFIHAADLHLDSPLAGLRERAQEKARHLADASRRAFEGLVAYATREDIDFVVIAGDIFDGDCADYKSALFLNEQLALLGRAGIPVVMIRGNHDAANSMSKGLTRPAGVREFMARRAESFPIEAHGVVVHGQSFLTKAVADNMVLGYPEPVPGMFNIGLLHSSVDGRPGHSPYAPCSIQDLRNKGYDYWALGHVHTFGELCEEPRVVFPGNLQGRHVNECGPKGFVTVTVEGHRVAKIEHIPMDVVRWARLAVDVSGSSAIGDICAPVSAALEREIERAEGRTLAVRLELIGACAAHHALAGDPSRLLAECTSVASQCGPDVWIEKVVVKTTVAPDSPVKDGSETIARLIEHIRSDPAEVETLLAPVMSGLDRLPAEVRRVAELEGSGDNVQARLLAAAEAAVLHRLSAAGRAG